jgi:hypothetical protein
VGSTGDERRLEHSEEFPVHPRHWISAIMLSMLDDLFVQFLLELLRALLVDELSGHVRRRIRWFLKGDATFRRTMAGVHRRTRAQLLHRLLTEIEEDV